MTLLLILVQVEMEANDSLSPTSHDDKKKPKVSGYCLENCAKSCRKFRTQAGYELCVAIDLCNNQMRFRIP